MPVFSNHFLRSKKNRHRLLQHAAFWMLLYVADVIVFGFGYDNIGYFAKIALLELPGQLLIAYAAVYFVLPRYRQNKKSREPIVVLVVTFLVAGFTGHALFILVPSYTDDVGLWSVPKILVRGFYSFLKACVFIGIKLAMLWYENEKRMTDLEKSKLESELKMLKDQVNPHFMFNTLNNLYGLIAQDPVQAQRAILGLSGILHYMLHESNRKVVPLQRELTCLQDYIALEKLRYTHNLSVSVHVDEAVKELSIVPLMIFPFVENSFKHGVSEMMKDAWVNISVSAYKHDFVFKIENSKRSLPSGNEHGIGLSNVRRRLELVYQSDHSLQVLNEGGSFLVVLKIALQRMNDRNAERESSGSTQALTERPLAAGK